MAISVIEPMTRRCSVCRKLEQCLAFDGELAKLPWHGGHLCGPCMIFDDIAEDLLRSLNFNTCIREPHR